MRTRTHFAKPKPPAFARVLDRLSCVRVKGKVTEHADVFVEAFGPPEVLIDRPLKLLYWNFQQEDGALGFSLLSPFVIGEKPKGEICVDVAVRRAGTIDSFMPWLLDRLGAAANGEGAPKFLNASRFVCVPA
jgi:hypothetical protein